MCPLVLEDDIHSCSLTAMLTTFASDYTHCILALITVHQLQLYFKLVKDLFVCCLLSAEGAFPTVFELDRISRSATASQSESLA